MINKLQKQLLQRVSLQKDSNLMRFLLLYQTLVVPRYLHCQILFCLDQKLHPCLTLLQEGLLLQQEGLEFAARNQRPN